MQAQNSQPVDRTIDVDSLMRALLRDVLGLSQDRVDAFDADTPLFGALPELDSMAVAGLLTEMEDRFDILIEDEDIDGDTFETFGSLVAFAQAKVG
ncbi:MULTISPECIES: acyl carrier protein [Sphingobium]|jgi:acyl carrier protein|uniref:Acyl carrier protein n=1 Tax=Sphingobium limneticum TaxID=1007511 RepID=A0A5J5IBM1_9SPHN|nr:MULTISPECIES: acyl carrier protein [Sphingobium]KAA9012733.1 acyl carrier protein [Sphingobium limneticum]KAA9020714.1 acyl carrier protein [Sphingobium limneticum]KAA9033040.1 acyl carrier protein [Sphingobium limneticum]MBU0931373.1 acyl carrier protein [Alphaproteobacteria bacterium]